MTLVALSDVPTVEIDPSALSAAAESLRNHANSATDSADQIMTTWNTLPASYEAPESGELLARMSVVPRAADDFAETTRRVAAIMAQLADQLALARAQETSSGPRSPASVKPSAGFVLRPTTWVSAAQTTRGGPGSSSAIRS